MKLNSIEELLRNTIDSSMDMIQVFEAVRDHKNEIIDFVWVLNNKTSEVIYGDVIGQRLLALNPGVIKEGIFNTFKKVVETGEPDQSVRYYVHEQFNGWFHQSTVKQGDGVATTTKNISDIKKAEQELQQSRNLLQNIVNKSNIGIAEIFRLKDEVAQRATDKYQTLFNSIDQGFNMIELIFDDNGKVTDYWQREYNPVFTKLTGLKDAIGKRMSELIPYVEPEWHQMVEDIYYTGEPIRIEYPVQALGKWFRAYMSRVGGEGSPFVACIYDDITDQKQREFYQQYLLKLNDAIRATGDSVEIEESVTAIAMAYFGADRCYYCTIEGDNAVIKWDARKEGLPSVAGIYPLSSFTLFRKVIDEGGAFVVNDAHATNMLDKPLLEICIRLQLISFLDIPVMKNGKAAGVFCLVQTTPRIWTETEIQLAGETAERTWAAVERARAEAALSESEAHLRQSESLLNGQKEAFQVAMNGSSLKASLEPLVRTVMEQTAGEGRAAFYRTLPDVEGLHLIAGITEAYAHDVNGFPIGPDSLACELAISKGEPIITPDIETDPLWEPYRQTARDHNYRGCWLFPVRTEGGPILGTFAMYFASPREPNLKELQLAAAISHAASIIISRYVELEERAQAEEELKLSEERFRTALSSADMAAWDWDIINDSVVWNEQHYYILGLQYDGKRQKADNFLRFVHPEDIDTVADALMQAVDETGVYRAEFRIVRKDKKVCWMSGYGRAIRFNSEGKATRMVGVMHDVTEQKQREKLKDDFISIASHELNTPVTSMKMYAEIVQDKVEELGDKFHIELLSKLNAQIDRLTLLISTLLDTTRIVEGKLKLTLEKVDLSELVRERTEEISRISSHNIELHVQSMPAAMADHERIGQVVTNLLSNAIKYSPKETTITVATVFDGVNIVVSVQDRGYGIPENDLSQIFERFFRVTANNMDTYPGMGLGLYISAQIIKRHGGTIAVQSQLGAGSIFTFTIPVLQHK